MAVPRGSFTILDKEGKQIQCQVLFAFENEANHQHYVIYTDHSLDDQGGTNAYAAIYDPTGRQPGLRPVESEQEWGLIQTILSQLQDSARDDI